MALPLASKQIDQLLFVLISKKSTNKVEGWRGTMQMALPADCPPIDWLAVRPHKPS